MIQEYEVVLSDGSRCNLQAYDNPYGAVGVMVNLTLSLIPSQ